MAFLKYLCPYLIGMCADGLKCGSSSLLLVEFISLSLFHFAFTVTRFTFAVARLLYPRTSLEIYKGKKVIRFLKMKSLSTSLILSALAATAVARTDLEGCISSATVNQWDQASMIWFVPETGEICDFPDCGGGRAPPKYNVPGCPLYTGTATLTPSYLPGYGPGAKPTVTGPTATGKPSSFTTTHSGTTTSATSQTGTISSSRSLITPGPTGPSSSGAASSSSPVPSESAVSSESATTPSQSSPNASSSEEPSSSPVVPISDGAAGVTSFNAAGVALALAAAFAVTL